MKQDNTYNSLTATPTQSELEQKLAENQRQIAIYNHDAEQKSALLAKLNTEIEEMNTLYRSGHKRQA